jgi:hypothetical protein
LEHPLHLCKLGIVCYLMHILTTYVASIHIILLTLLRLINSLCCCYSGFFILLASTCLHIVVVSSTICVMFINLS